MPRTNPYPGPSTGGHTSEIIHIARLTDHAGQPLTRIRYEFPERPIPADFHKLPVFALQVYTTLDLGLHEIEESSGKRPRLDSSQDRTNLASLARFLNFSMDRAQKAKPIFDIYERPLHGPLEMLEHQRNEIQYRKAQASDPGILLIPKLVYDVEDSRKLGFFIAIDSDAFKGTARVEHDPRGPLLVTFDRRYPDASSAEIKQRLECDERLALREQDEIYVYPEKLEAEVLRNQFRSLSEHLGYRYASSYVFYDENDDPDETPPMDFGLDDDEIGASFPTPTIAMPEERTELSALVVTKGRAVIRIISERLKSDEAAMLRYLIYVSYLAPDDDHGLERAAKVFAAALSKHLPHEMTVDLEFRPPSQPSLSSVLQTDLERRPGQLDNSIGVLTSATGLPTETIPEEFVVSAEPLPERVFPISRNDSPRANDPRTCNFEPYKRFLVILDKPGFAQQAGVLFLLTDGGRPRSQAGMREMERDYVQMQIWRSAGMREVAARMALLSRV